MVWVIEWEETSRKQFKKLDFSVQKKILHYLQERVTTDPRDFGKKLVGDKAGLWRYRIEDYRVICRLEEYHLVVVIIEVGHRKEIYD